MLKNKITENLNHLKRNYLERNHLKNNQSKIMLIKLFGKHLKASGFRATPIILTLIAILATNFSKPVFVAVSGFVKERKLPIYCVGTDEKKVAISFDAAWGADDTDELLKILRENDVKTTFFVCGYWVEKYADEVKKMYAEGHEIANHSDTHAHVTQLNSEQNKKEIEGAHQKVKDLLGIEMNLYRPPYGEYNDTVLDAAEQMGYYTIQWDVDSHDWMKKGVEYEINQVLNHKHLGNGSILLFHNDTEDTPKALDTIIKGIKAKGFEIVKVSELIHKENYYLDHEGRQILK